MNFIITIFLGLCYAFLIMGAVEVGLSITLIVFLHALVGLAVYFQRKGRNAWADATRKSLK